MSKFFRVVVFLIVTALLSFSQLSVANSQQQSLTITPPNQTIYLREGSNSAGVNLKNNYDYALNLSVDLFTDKLRKILNSEKPDEALLPFVNSPIKTISLSPGQSLDFGFTISSNQSLPEGEYYITLLFKNDPSSTSGIGINSILPAQFRILKTGSDQPKLSMQISDTPSTISFNKPKSINYKISNPTAFTANPSGVIHIIDINSAQYTKNILEIPELSASKSYSEQLVLQQLTNNWKPGRYKLQVIHKFDQNSEQQIIDQSFYYLPWWLVLPIISIFVPIILIAHKHIRNRPKKSASSNKNVVL